MIAKWGGGIALLLFIILVVKFLIRLPGNVLSPGEKVEHLIQILIVSISLIVVAVPEGLPLAVTLSLAYATIRMIQDNNLVRVLKACETIGNATTICSDKTGTLTENKMTVVMGTLGMVDKFEKDSQILIPIQADAMNMESFFNQLPLELTKLLLESIALNSTAFEGHDDNGYNQFIGSKTETALLEMAKLHLNMTDVATERNTAKPRRVQQFPFSSHRKCMGVVFRTDHGYRLYVKGASEIVLGQSSQVITTEGFTRNLSDETRRVIASTIEDYASHSLRTIAFAYRDFREHISDQFEQLFTDMVFIGVVGIKDPLRPGVSKAVGDCCKAGVMVRMVTGDNVSTAKAIATECGIYTDGIIMEGPQFRKLSRPEMKDVIPRLQVLARSSPEDKRILVKQLRRNGQIVAVTGDGTNDAPALRAADVGFSMGLSGTEVAKAASSIILMDDNFTSIVKAIAWGRCVNDAVKKFLQVFPRTNVLTSSSSLRSVSPRLDLLSCLQYSAQMNRLH
jgi:P-type Ca2+ transporter type 2C